MPELDFNSWAGLAAIGAAVGLFWSNLRNLLSQLSGVLVYQSSISSQLTEAVVTELRLNYKVMPTGLLWYACKLMKLDGAALYRLVPWCLPNGISIWRGKHGTFLVSPKDGFFLYSLRFFSDPTALVRESLENYNRKRDEMGITSTRYYVQRVIGTAGDGGRQEVAAIVRQGSNSSSEAPVDPGAGTWNYPIPGVDRSFMYPDQDFMPDATLSDPLRGLFFPERVHTMLKALNNWYTQREWYYERGLPWRTGVLLHGPGGTGKSSLARVIAEKMGLPLYQFYLNTLTDKEFVHEWDRMDAPCVVALEDFDTVFHGREPVTIHKSLSFECVLNQISGVNSMSGVLLVVTTNNLQHIDAAMGQVDEHGRPTRPGRIDHICYLGAAEPEQRQQIAQHVLGGWADDLIPLALRQLENATAAQCTSICAQLALERLAENETQSRSRLHRHAEGHVEVPEVAVCSTPTEIDAHRVSSRG